MSFYEGGVSWVPSWHFVYCARGYFTAAFWAVSEQGDLTSFQTSLLVPQGGPSPVSSPFLSVEPGRSIPNSSPFLSAVCLGLFQRIPCCPTPPLCPSLTAITIVCPWSLCCFPHADFPFYGRGWATPFSVQYSRCEYNWIGRQLCASSTNSCPRCLPAKGSTVISLDVEAFILAFNSKGVTASRGPEGSLPLGHCWRASPSLQEICHVVCWASPHIFMRFYQPDVTALSLAHTVLGGGASEGRYWRLPGFREHPEGWYWRLSLVDVYDWFPRAIWEILVNPTVRCLTRNIRETWAMQVTLR